MRAFRLSPPQRRLWQAFGVAAAVPVAVSGVLLWSGAAATEGLLILAAATLAALSALWLLVDRRLTAPLGRVARGAEILARTHPEHRLELSGRHWLDGLPAAIQQLGTALAHSQADRDQAAARWAAETEQRKARLEALVQALREAVLVCDQDGLILLYNESARRLLRDQPALGLGRSVFDVLNRPPLEHGLDLLRRDDDSQPAARGTDLVCSTARTGRLLRCRLATLPQATTGFVLTLEDLSAPTRDLLRRERDLRRCVEALRDPMASLRAGVESAEVAGRSGNDGMRRQFEGMVHRQALRLAEGFCALSREAESVLTAPWRLADMHSDDLIGSVLRRNQRGLPRVAIGGQALWLRAEGYLIGQVLTLLLGRLAGDHHVKSVEITPSQGDGVVYLDLRWQGRPVPSARLAGWLQAPLADAGGTVSAAEVLDRHDSAVWSHEIPEQPGHALLRMPLPAATATAGHEPELPGRPEFYDFDLGPTHRALGELAQRPLRALNFVVFDTETTGLDPRGGDEIIAIGAVRVTGGRLLQGETFQRLVDPGRPIPSESTRFHGITDDDIRGEASIAEVLPEFREFVGDAVLAAHNAAFDMRFLQLKERATGVRFDTPVLDTLLLSILIHDHTSEHALEAIARRLGVAVTGRHTALGDALTTAGILVRLLELLPAHGIVTLQDAIDSSQRMVEFRRQQRAF
jgi:DNA polymerase-3 subunit epsilon